MSDYTTIPDFLQERGQWLYWNSSNATPRAPLARPQATTPASWSDPDEWIDFATAVANAEQHEHVGIGYVNAIDNDDYPRGLVGSIDIDGAADDDGHARDWVPSLEPFFEREAYIEWSPSETGLRIPVIGLQVPGWWSDFDNVDGEHKGVEVLTNKFSTYTGDQLRGAGDEAVEYGDWLDDWLREVHKAITGDDPLAERDPDVDELGDGAHARDFDGDEWLTSEVAADALDAINPDCGYDTWKDIGMALANHLGRVDGGSLFKQWSRAGTKWDSDAERQADRIIDDASGYNYDAGTLVHHATSHGWDASAAAREQLSTRSDGGAVAGDASEPDTDDSDTDSTTAPDPSADAWDEIYHGYRAAEDAEERLTPRHEAAMQLLDESEWRTIEDNDIIWKYDPDSGIFRDNGVSEARTRLSRQLKEQYRKHEQSEILAQVRGRTTVAPDQLGGPPKYICAENCVIEIDADGVTTHDHDPSYEFVGRVQTHYDTTAECPAWQSFLDDIMPRDERGNDRDKIQEFAGYMLMHWGLPHHKSLFLVGPTASGKSTFLDAIRTMLGTDSVANLTPQQMTSERFGGSELYGCWANIRNDIPDDLIENTGQFKEIVAGDPIKAERKFKQPFMFEPTAKHAFSANALPEPSTDDNAFFRRVMLVSFREQIPAAERDKHLDDKLEAEHPGILNWCLEGLRRLIDQGGFTGTVAPWQTEQKWEKWADSVKRFHKDCLEEDNNGFVSSAKIYGVYRQFCDAEGIPQMVEMNQLIHDLSSRFKFDQDRQYVDGDLTRGLAYAGLSDYGADLAADLED